MTWLLIDLNINLRGTYSFGHTLYYNYYSNTCNAEITKGSAQWTHLKFTFVSSSLMLAIAASL